MKRCIAAALLVALMLSGCGGSKPYTPTGDGLTWDDDYTGPVYTHPDDGAEQVLSVAYYPDRSMNPYKCTDFTNRALFSLIYQGLFTTDRAYQVFPVLCKSYSVSPDARTYTFYIEESATFSDGSVLKPEDVVASLNQAKASEIYGGRFSHIRTVAKGADGGIVVTLDTAYENLPLLLDIPILRADQLAADIPLGTGAYVLEEAELRRRDNWWCRATSAITAETISLVAAQNATHIRDRFEFYGLSIVCADPGSDRYVDYRCDYELWDCENGIFLYLACNRDSKVFSNADLRAALTYAIDRNKLAEECYRGFARSAELPMSPLSPYYSTSLAAKYSYNAEKFKKAVGDSAQDTELTLLVNADDSLRLRVAREIVKMLSVGGWKVTLSERSGSSYKNALYNREYDLYLGQTVLSPNMDLSAFLSSGGALSYGGISDLSAYTLCLQALENHGNFYTLHKTVMDNGLICPILFRSYAIYAVRGLLTGMTPSRDCVYSFDLGKTMEDALIPQASE